MILFQLGVVLILSQTITCWLTQVSNSTGTHCSSLPCQNNASCVPLTSGTYYKCKCPVGYSGVNCEVDHCSPSPCQHHHGLCVHSNNSKHYVCNCNHVYTGEHCEDFGVILFLTKTVTCFLGCNIDCHHGDCHGSIGHNYCSCNRGWYGDRCDQESCTSSSCEPNGYCGMNICHCHTGFSGLHCEVDSCAPNPCQNGGRCHRRSTGRGYECSCDNHYTGDNCEVAPVTSANDTTTTTKPTLLTTTTKPTPITKRTTTLVPSFTTHCSKLDTVFDILEKKIETSILATPCSSGNHSSHEAFVINNCHPITPSTWKQGYNVMSFCDKIPPYTPIASFENGKYFSTDSRSGIFIGCLHGPDGFRAAFQRCDEAAVFENITVGESMFNNNPYNYFTLEI